MKDKIIILLGIIFIGAFLFIAYKYKSNMSDYDFKIYFWNAGKADAILLSKNNKYIMIDTGEEELSEEILAYFKNNNITKLDYLIITHFDKDHVGSASSIIDNIEVETVLQSNSPKESEYYTAYLSALSNKEITPITVNGNYEISFEGLKIIVNGPTMVYDNSASNNSSLIVSITYNDNNFLFMGDAENARIKDFVSNNKETFDFIKIPYHGRKLKRMNELIDNIKPEYAVITSGVDTNNIDTINTLNNHQVKTYLTRNGDIYVYSDGVNIKVK